MIKTFFKKLLWVTGIILALYAGVALVLPRVLSMEKITAFLQDKVREQTGRDLAFTNAHFSFWPSLGVELEQVTFSNPAWASQKNMISLGKADVALELMPLLDHHIIVKKFILNEPVIYLETSADGQKSWDFSQAPILAESGASSESHKSTSAPDSQAFDFRFGRIQVSKGKLIFADQQKKTTASVEGVDIEVTLPDLKSPLRLKGALTYRDKRLTLDIGLDRPLDFFNGRTTSGQASLKADDFTVKADGAFATQGTLLKGDVDVSTPNLPAVLAWARNTPEQKLPFEKLSFTGAARLVKGEIILKESALTLDDVKATGDVDVEFSGKPRIFSRLTMNKLNLDRFTGGGASAAPGAGGETPAASSGEGGWDTKPLDFSGLRAVNADLKLTTQGFSLRGTEVGPSVLSVQLLDGNLHFTSSDATLSEGKFSSDMRLNAAATPSMAFSFNMTGVQAQPILATFMHFKKLSGAANAHVSLTAAGDNQREIISSLAGNGDFDFKNGEMRGIDLVKIAKLIQQHSSDVGVDDGSTKFVDLTGTFSIVKGIVSNTDMRMKGKVVQATGQGVVDLPKKYIQYRAIPMLLTSDKAPPGLSVPVKIVGPFDNIRIIPDFASAVQDIIKNPGGAKAMIKNIRENVKQNDILQGILNLKKFGKRSLSPAPLPPEQPPQAAPQAEPAAPVEPQPQDQPQPTTP